MKFLNVIIFSAIALFANAQRWPGLPAEKPKERIALKYGPLNMEKRTDSAMQHFRDYGLGQFIHWGLYAIPGNEWNGVRANTASEWIRSWGGATAPKDWKNTYDNLYKQFDPKDFDAKRWAKQAKAMGAKYVIFTTKHHDGFCMWPSKYSNFTIAQTPYKKDIVKQVVDAYTAEGIDVYLYYSIMEWSNPDYMSKEPKTEEEKTKFKKFLDYTRNQLLELLGNYPQLKGLWFDGTWDTSWKSAYDFAYNLEKELRDKHPGLIIGSRFRSDEYGKRHFDSNGDLLGDYQQGWERKIPETYEQLNGNDWDCVMTILPDHWGYVKNWSGMYAKTSDDLIEMLMHCRSMGGNFVLNFGPDANGKMHPEEDAIENNIGSWVKGNAEAVFKVTHAFPAPTGYGYYTQNDSLLYLTVFNRPVNNLVRIKIPRNATYIPANAVLLKGNKPLQMKFSDIGLDRDNNYYYDILLPDIFVSKEPFVIKIYTRKSKSHSKELEKAHI